MEDTSSSQTFKLHCRISAGKVEIWDWHLGYPWSAEGLWRMAQPTRADGDLWRSLHCHNHPHHFPLSIYVSDDVEAPKIFQINHKEHYKTLCHLLNDHASSPYYLIVSLKRFKQYAFINGIIILHTCVYMYSFTSHSGPYTHSIQMPVCIECASCNYMLTIIRQLFIQKKYVNKWQN